MDEDFQFVDLAANESNKDLKTLTEDVQKLKESWSLEHNEVKSLQKQVNECRETIGKMNEELKQMKEERNQMREKMKSLETKNADMLMQIPALKEELSKMNHLDVSKAVVSHTNDHPIDDLGGGKDKKQTTTTTATTTNETMKIKSPLKQLDKSLCYACKACGTHIGLENDISNRAHQVGQGPFTEQKRGYIFNTGYNLTLGVTKTEEFSTGLYEIAWVTCTKCSASLGWKYLSASNENNKSKVGKYCLARYSLTSPQDRTEQ